MPIVWSKETQAAKMMKQAKKVKFVDFLKPERAKRDPPD
jgi:hypothetical protein